MNKGFFSPSGIARGRASQAYQQEQRDAYNASRRYRVVSVSDKPGCRTALTTEPMTHAEACTAMGKFTVHPHRRLMLEEIPR